MYPVCVQILEILVRAVVEDLRDSHGETSSSLRSKVQELLGRATARHPTDGQMWLKYAKIYGDGHSADADDNDKVSRSSSLAPSRSPNQTPRGPPRHLS